jgi:predicted HicB family RNase H-like nuclease
MNNEEFQKEIEFDRKLEALQEKEDSHYVEWKEDHLEGLKDDFAEENQDDFEEFCRAAYNSEAEK